MKTIKTDEAGEQHFSFFPNLLSSTPLLTHLSLGPGLQPDSQGQCLCSTNKLSYPLHVGLAYESPSDVVPVLFCAFIKNHSKSRTDIRQKMAR